MNIYEIPWFRFVNMYEFLIILAKRKQMSSLLIVYIFVNINGLSE